MMRRTRGSWSGVYRISVETNGTEMGGAVAGGCKPERVSPGLVILRLNRLADCCNSSSERCWRSRFTGVDSPICTDVRGDSPLPEVMWEEVRGMGSSPFNIARKGGKVLDTFNHSKMCHV